MNFSFGKQLNVIDSLHFSNELLDNLVKNLRKSDSHYLSEECNENVLGKQKRFYPYDYMGSFEKFKESLTSKDNFYSLLNGH